MCHWSVRPTVSHCTLMCRFEQRKKMKEGCIQSRMVCRLELAQDYVFFFCPSAASEWEARLLGNSLLTWQAAANVYAHVVCLLSRWRICLSIHIISLWGRVCSIQIDWATRPVLTDQMSIYKQKKRGVLIEIRAWCDQRQQPRHAAWRQSFTVQIWCTVGGCKPPKLDLP